MSMRDENEIADVREDAEDAVMTGVSKWPGMTYEQGVANALAWALGDSSDSPLAD